MYEELLIGLRGHARRMGCDNRCPCYDAENRGYATCSEELAEKAADAIEELSRKYTEERNAAVELTGELASKPRWIPVTERLPDEYVNVLCHLMSLDRQSWYFSIDHLMEDGCWWKATNSWKFEVTHWMPLPEPPKEGTE